MLPSPAVILDVGLKILIKGQLKLSRAISRKEYVLRSTSKGLTALDRLIRKEADQLLEEKGLRELLRQYGIPHVSGSYLLHLMAWRDLDIYLETESLTELDFFTLGGRITSILNPARMSFRNERIAQTPGLPYGLYWGVYLGNEREGAWKLDIWAVDANECQRLLKYCNDLAERLTPTTRLQILGIKSQCWNDPDYRRSYTSTDIYCAVLDEGITDIKGFREYLQSK